jgi:hypothetical protein
MTYISYYTDYLSVLSVTCDVIVLRLTRLFFIAYRFGMFQQLLKVSPPAPILKSAL